MIVSNGFPLACQKEACADRQTLTTTRDQTALLGVLAWRYAGRPNRQALKIRTSDKYPAVNCLGDLTEPALWRYAASAVGPPRYAGRPTIKKIEATTWLFV